jgi:hypothetical protein
VNEENRGPWYLLTGLVLGAVFGIVISWVILPVRYVDTAPDSLRADFKDAYRALIAVAYLSSGNVERARYRLDALEAGASANLSQRLILLAEQGSRPPSEIQALTLLGAALSGQEAPELVTNPVEPSETPEPVPSASPTPLLIQTEATPGSEASETPNPETPRPRSTITRTPTLVPSRTPTLTPGAAFALESQEQVCDLNLAEALIQVEVLDAAHQPVPGIEILVRWDGGEDFFYTGLKPEFSLGYADFGMTPGVVYQLQLASGGSPVTDLAAVECDAETGRFWGGWRLTFVQP